jgi:AraC-like DNA-binding protein
MANSFAQLYHVDPSPRAQRLFWHVLSIGPVTLDSADHHEAMDKPGAHLFWVRSGAGVLEVPGNSYGLSVGLRFWLVDMKKPRTCSPLPGGRIVNTGFRFGGPELEAWREELGGNNEFRVEPHDARFIRRQIRELARLARQKPANFEWDIHAVITEILGRLLKSRGLLQRSQAEVPKPLARAINRVMSDPYRDWKVTEVAREAGISRAGLQSMFREHRHESIHEFLLRMRMDQARQLLCDERLAIKEVSARLNFSNEFYFSRFFRKRTGMSPRDYRRSVRVSSSSNRMNSR